LSKSAWTVMQVQDRVQVLGRVMIRRAPRAGQDAGIAAEASRFLQISAPSLLLNAVSTCIRNHLLAQLDVVVASRARLAPCMGPSIPAVCMPAGAGAAGDACSAAPPAAAASAACAAAAAAAAFAGPCSAASASAASPVPVSAPVAGHEAVSTRHAQRALVKRLC